MLVPIKDPQLLRWLEKQCFKTEKYSEININMLIKQAHCYGMSLEDNVLAGYLIVQPSGDDYEILRMGVLPSFRKCKIATNHLKMWLATIKSNCFLEVKANNIAAINVYQKCGFKIINTRKNYYHDQQDALIMKLE